MRKIEISFPRGVETMILDMDALTSDMVDNLVRFAIQARVSNAFASMAEKDGYGVEAWTEEAQRHIAEAESGEMRFGAGGGGARLDAVEREARAIFVTLLVKKGAKKAEADKRATKWRDGLADEVIDRILAKAKTNVAAREIDITVDL